MKRPVEKRMAPGLGGMELAYSQGKDLLADARAIIEAARGTAYRMVNAALVQRNWLLGKRIAEEELKGEERAEYGRGVVKELAEKLTAEYGNGFSVPALYQFVEFFKAFPILYSLRIKSGDILSWTHYRILLQVKNAEARDWLEFVKNPAVLEWKTIFKVENFDLRRSGSDLRCRQEYGTRVCHIGRGAA